MELSPKRRVLITGAGQRLGKAMAEALGSEGYGVAIHYHSSSEGAEQAARNIRAAGGQAELIQADLSDELQLDTLIERAADALGGKIGILINNASAFHDDDASSHTRENWDMHMNVNLRAPVKLSQMLSQHLNADERGLIINMIDQRVWKLNPKFFTYTLSKSALWSATKTLAQALAPNIRVNGIGPGPTLQGERQSEDDFQKQIEATLTQRGANPDEIVRAVRFLIDADAVTGQMIAVDGGQHLVWQTPDVVDIIE